MNVETLHINPAMQNSNSAKFVEEDSDAKAIGNRKTVQAKPIEGIDNSARFEKTSVNSENAITLNQVLKRSKMSGFLKEIQSRVDAIKASQESSNEKVEAPNSKLTRLILKNILRRNMTVKSNQVESKQNINSAKIHSKGILHTADDKVVGFDINLNVESSKYKGEEFQFPQVDGQIPVIQTDYQSNEIDIEILAFQLGVDLDELNEDGFVSVGNGSISFEFPPFLSEEQLERFERLFVGGEKAGDILEKRNGQGNEFIFLNQNPQMDANHNKMEISNRVSGMASPEVSANNNHIDMLIS